MQSLWWVVSAQGLRVHATILPLQSVLHADRRALAQLLQEQISEALNVIDHK
jgi:hypothetical protein